MISIFTIDEQNLIVNIILKYYLYKMNWILIIV